MSPALMADRRYRPFRTTATPATVTATATAVTPAGAGTGTSEVTGTTAVSGSSAASSTSALTATGITATGITATGITATGITAAGTRESTAAGSRESTAGFGSTAGLGRAVGRAVQPGSPGVSLPPRGEVRCRCCASVYNGELNRVGLPHGFGTLENAALDYKYVGRFRGGRRCGEGQVALKDGQILLKGNFSDGALQRSGVLHATTTLGFK
ncbi:hypothetical protein GNI_017230, partial [Gregarina niphandrodes]